MNTILKYTVLRERNIQSLQKEVERLIQEHGWQPLGGVAIENTTDSEGRLQPAFYLQALVRDRK